MTVIGMLVHPWIGIWVHPSCTITQAKLLAKFWDSANCFPLPQLGEGGVEIWRMGTWVHSYTDIPVKVGAKSWKIGVRRSPNDIEVLWLRLQTHAGCWLHPKSPLDV